MKHIDISKRLKELIALNNMNITEFAEYVGVSRTSLTGYLNQNVTPTIDPLVQICEKCNVSLDWLCSLSEKRYFLTIADIIRAILELQEIEDFFRNLEVSKIDMVTCDKYTCIIKLNGEVSKFCQTAPENYSGYICQFFDEWKTTIQKFKMIDDKDFIDNCMQMWLDKKLEYYSKIPLETKLENS